MYAAITIGCQQSAIGSSVVDISGPRHCLYYSQQRAHSGSTSVHFEDGCGRH
jgi:hypothetical protein